MTASSKSGPIIVLDGFNRDALVVSAIVALRDNSDLDLVASRQALESCIGGANVRIRALDQPAAERLVSLLSDSGFRAHLVPGLRVISGDEV
jgi:hypothetical protein